MTPYTAPHLDPEDLEKYSRKHASEVEMARIEEHLLLCEPCREELQNTEAFTMSMRTAAADLRREPPKERSWWSVPRLAPAFAGLALLLLGIVVAPRFIATSQAPLAISLAATRGAGLDATAPAGRPLALTPDLTGLPADPSYRLEIVDEYGTPTWRGRYIGSQSPAIASAQRAGAHFVRIYSSSGVLLREYGLVVNK